MRDVGSKGGEWYRSLVGLHGASRVQVGSVPYREDEAFWLSSRDEARPTVEEHTSVYDAVGDAIRALVGRRLPKIDSLRLPYLLGDFYGWRNEMLLFDAATMSDHVGVLIEVVCLTQTKLREPPASGRWRVGYFAGDGTLLIYADAVFLGADRLGGVRDMAGIFPEWLAWLVKAEAEHRLRLRRSWLTPSR